MTATLPKFQTLVRAQSALLRIEMQNTTKKASYIALALVMGLICLGMLNVAAYLGLSLLMAPAWSALILAVADAILAIVLVQAAGKVHPGPEVEIVREVRDIALDQLSAEAQSVRDELEQVREGVQRIRSGFSAFSGGVNAIGPIVELLKKSPARSGSKNKDS